MMIVISKLLILIAALFGFSKVFKNINSYSKAITLILAISILATLLPNELIKSIGYFIFEFALLISIIYVILLKSDRKSKILMLLISVPVFISFTFKMMVWPFGYEIIHLMFIPIIAYIMLLYRKINIKNEIGFLTIIATDALIQFLIITAYWLNLS